MIHRFFRKAAMLPNCKRFILLLLLTAACTRAWADGAWQENGNPLCIAADNQTDPAVVEDGAGGVIVTWQDERNPFPARTDIYAQRLDADGNSLWAEYGVVICGASDYQYEPHLSGDNSGGAFIVWHDTRINGTFEEDIFAQHVDNSGNPLWTVDGVLVCDAADSQRHAKVLADGSGGCFVVWGSGSTPVESQTYCQRLDADGNRLWDPAGVLVSSAPLFQTYFLEHCLMADGSGGMFICWQEMHSSTDYDIFCQRVNADSSMNWADKAVICDAVDNQLHPVMVSDCAGGAIVVWQDYRKGTAANIFTQHVDTVAAIPSGLKTAFPSATATIPRSIRTQPATTAAAPISFGRIYAAS